MLRTKFLKPMKTRHYFEVIAATAALTFSLQSLGQSPYLTNNLSADKRFPNQNSLPVLIERVEPNKGNLPCGSKTRYSFGIPDSKLYTSKRLGNVTTYTSNARPVAQAPDGEANVTVVFDYDKKVDRNPMAIFYNNKGNNVYFSSYGVGDTVTMKVPVDTFDILSRAFHGSSSSHVIKEQVRISHDTIITIHQNEAKPMPLIAFDENGNQLRADILNGETVVEKGNVDPDGAVEVLIYLKGQGVVFSMVSMGLSHDVVEDSVLWNKGQIYNFYINELSNRYSVIAIPHCFYSFNGRNDIYLARIRHESADDWALSNSAEDCILYDEAFKSTPKDSDCMIHGLGYVSETLCGDDVYGSSALRADSTLHGDKVYIHLSAPREYGNRDDAVDLIVNLAYGENYRQAIYTNTYEDENGNPILVVDTSYTMTWIYGETFIEHSGDVEYADNGHAAYGDDGFQYSPVTYGRVEYPGYSVFSAQKGKRKGIYGDSAPMLSMMSKNYTDDYWGKIISWSPCYIGRLGEVRTTDNNYSRLEMHYNDSIVFDSDTLSDLSSFGYDWAMGQHPDGVWELNMINTNILVDGIQGRNTAKIIYDARKEDAAAPTLQMLNFVDSDNVVTDRFGVGDEGILQFSCGDFNYVFDVNKWSGYFDCQPVMVKVEYSPYGEDKWSELDVDEDPSLYHMPAFGHFYRGQLSQVSSSSSNGWFDLKVTLTDEAGNSQEQTISPAFKIENLNDIGIVSSGERKADGRVYDLQGRVVSKPIHGVYIMNGKKVVVK